MKVLFCGFGRAGLECLYKLFTSFKLSNLDLLVFTHDTKENQQFISHLKDLKISYFFNNINEHKKDIIAFKPKYLLSVYYRFIINKEILSIVNYRAMNLHPSLLPKYRGAMSSVWAILNDESITGITYHYINERIDDGNIILQKKVVINDWDTAFSLYHKLISVFLNSFTEAFQLLIDEFSGYSQKGKSTYFNRDLPYDGVRDLKLITKKEANLFIRAMFFPPFEGAKFILDGNKEIEVLDVRLLEKYNDFFKK